MSQQTAIAVEAVGKPVISITRPIPQPGPRQVQLRVTVTALNPHDHKSRDTGLFTQDGLPTPLGNDIAGVVTAVGTSVVKFKVGDRVFTYGNITGDAEYKQKGLQQYTLADEDFTAMIPEGFSDHDVATLPVNTTCGVIGLFDESALGIPAPWTDEARSFNFADTQLLIWGGGSNCGKFGVQLAKIAGIGKIVVVGGPEEELKKYGATHVLDRHGGDEAVAKRIHDIVGDDLVYVYDTINPPDTLYVSINALSSTRSGKVARLLPIGPHETAKVKEKKAAYEVKDIMGLAQLKPATAKPFWDHLEEYLVQGKIVPLAYEAKEGLDAAAVNEVLDRYRDGKKVIQPHFRISK